MPGWIDVLRSDCSVPLGNPHRPHFKIKHGSGWASIGNATVRLPHCSQTGLKACLSVRVTSASKPMLKYPTETQPSATIARSKSSEIKSPVKKALRKIPTLTGYCNGRAHLTLTDRGARRTRRTIIPQFVGAIRVVRFTVRLLRNPVPKAIARRSGARQTVERLTAAREASCRRSAAKKPHLPKKEEK
jgi:hypothetical protein